MKHIAIVASGLLAAGSALGQGAFSAQNAGAGLTAPVTAIDLGGYAGSGYYAQVWAAAPGGTLASVTEPIPFRDTAAGDGSGIFIGGIGTVPGVAGGSPADFQVVAWDSTLGDDYTAAVAAGMGGVGASDQFSVTLTEAPATPALLVGLTSFSVSAIIPEPSVAALGLLGAGLLLIRRKK